MATKKNKDEAKADESEAPADDKEAVAEAKESEGTASGTESEAQEGEAKAAAAEPAAAAEKAEAKDDEKAEAKSEPPPAKAKRPAFMDEPTVDDPDADPLPNHGKGKHAGEIKHAARSAHDEHDDHAHGAEHDAHGGHAHAHKPNRKEYVVMFFVLLTLTALEVGIVKVPGISKTLMRLGLVGMAVTKAACVGLYYMHLKSETRIMRLGVALPFTAPAIYALVLISEAAWRLTR